VSPLWCRALELFPLSGIWKPFLFTPSTPPYFSVSSDLRSSFSFYGIYFYFLCIIEIMWYFSFSSWLVSIMILSFSYIIITKIAGWHYFWQILHYLHITQFLSVYPPAYTWWIVNNTSISKWWTHSLTPPTG
jgi:hypothetical protein